MAKTKSPLKNHKNTTIKYHYKIFIQKKNESIIITLLKSYKQDIFISGEFPLILFEKDKNYYFSLPN